MRGRGLAGAIAVVLICVLAGCSSDPPASQLPTSSPTTTQAPTTTVSPTPTAEPGPPTVPPEAQLQTPDGAAAFVRHWFDVLGYSQAALDSEPLRALDDGSCSSCDNFSNSIDIVRDDGDRLVGGEVTVHNAEPSAIQGDGGTTVNTLATFAEQRIVGPDGSSEVLGPIEENVGLFFSLVPVESAWRVDQVQLLG